MLQPRAWIYSELNKLSSGPISVENFIARELAEILAGPADDRSRAYIVLVEDLDRTTPEYTAELLDALTFWREVSQTFFIIACSKNHLAAASKELPQADEHREDQNPLPKHIHYTIELPSLVGDSDSCADFVLRLMTDLELAGRANELLEILQDRERRATLLSPLLMRRRPRDIIETLNRLLGEFYSYPGEQDPKDLDHLSDQVVKQLVVQAIWPDEYREKIFPIFVPDRETLESVGADVHYRTAVLLAGEAVQSGDAPVALGVLAEAAQVDLSLWPQDLLIYLASPPALLPPDDDSGISKLPTLPGDGPRGGSARGRTTPGPFSTIKGSGSATKPDQLVFDRRTNASQESTYGDPLGELSIKLDLAMEDEEADWTALLSEVATTISQADELAASDGASIGNIALRVAARDPGFAWELHSMAHQLAPEHANIRLNLADFLLDNVPGDREAAEIALAHVEWCQQNQPDHREGRARHLRFRALATLGVDDPEIRASVPDLIDYVMTTESNAIWAELLERLIAGLSWYEEAEQLIKRIVQDRPQRTFEALRGWADLLVVKETGSPEEALATEVLRWLCCESGLVFDSSQALTDERGADKILADTAHNLATVLYANDFDDVAAAIWRWVYEASPDGMVGRAYSRLVSNHLGDKETALRVLNGQEISLPIWTAEEARDAADALPVRFATPNQELWWEDLPVEPAALEQQRQHYLANFAR